MLVESRFNKALVRFDQSALQMLDNLSQKHIFFNHTTHPHLPPPQTWENPTEVNQAILRKCGHGHLPKKTTSPVLLCANDTTIHHHRIPVNFADQDKLSLI